MSAAKRNSITLSKASKQVEEEEEEWEEKGGEKD